MRNYASSRSLKRKNDENEAPTTYPPRSLPATPLTRRQAGLLTPQHPNLPRDTPPSLPTKRPTKIHRNGYVVEPKTPSFEPYQRAKNRRKNTLSTHLATPTEDLRPLEALETVEAESWNQLVIKHGILRPGQELLEFQVETANHVISQKGDLVVIAPTGAGKSLTWLLPILARGEGISLVIVPYTSLGHQGEGRHYGTSIGCTFIHAKSKSTSSLLDVAHATGPHVVYICPEMLETPKVAELLHSPLLQAKLSGIYIDEAQCAHENASWRPAYSRLSLLRQVVGENIPLVCLSATLPKSYCDTLEKHAGLKHDYSLINLGNFRPELSIIIHKMEHDASSFKDLRFIVPWNSTFTSIKKSIVYCDDIEMLTAMFWWFHTQLGSLGLPLYYLDILHAGLSEEHQKKADKDFREGYTRILLGTEKIGLGMDYPKVEVVIQYKCRDLTLVQLEQRRGRAARGPGETAVGIVLVEKSMTGDDGSLSVSAPKSEDPGLLDFIQNTSKCKQAIVDHWFRHPPRPPEPCQRCSNCNPKLRVSRELTWIMENPGESTANPDLAIHEPTPTEQEAQAAAEQIFDRLKEWRLTEWKTNWTHWRRYGPENIVSTADLLDLSKRARQITNLEELFAQTHIPHWPHVGQPLFDALQHATCEVWGLEPLPNRSSGADHSQQSEDSSAAAPTATPDSPTDITQIIQPPQPDSSRGHTRGRARGVGRLAPGEGVIDFSTTIS